LGHRADFTHIFSRAPLRTSSSGQRFALPGSRDDFHLLGHTASSSSWSRLLTNLAFREGFHKRNALVASPQLGPFHAKTGLHINPHDSWQPWATQGSPQALETPTLHLGKVTAFHKTRQVHPSCTNVELSYS